MISLKTLLSLSLFLTFAFSIAGWAVVVNALVKASSESSYIKSVSVDNGFDSVDIDYNDLSVICIVIVGSSALLTILSLLSAFLQLLSIGKRRLVVFLQAYFMSFGALCVLPTVIACDVIFATRSGQITATIDGFAVPQSVIQQVEQAFGISPEYKTKSYLEPCAIVPWFAFLYATLSALLLYRIARNTKDHAVVMEEKTEGTYNEKIPKYTTV